MTELDQLAAHDRCSQRSARLHALVDALPGANAYENRRPIRVPARFAGLTLLEFLTQRFAHVPVARWQAALAQGHIAWEGRQVATPDMRVAGGTQLVHVLPATVEPWVDANLHVLFEDEYVMVVDKSAPLPMHPCGRFCRNTLVGLLRAGLGDFEPYIVHRLDADTTGAVVLAKDPSTARFLVDAFANRRVHKRYIAHVMQADALASASVCHAPIAKSSAVAGTRHIDPQGRESWTNVGVRQRMADGTALVEAQPHGGRTHQIRLHLAAMGHPIVGDRAYAHPERAAGEGLVGGGLRLHAWILAVPHPQGTTLSVRAPWPTWARKLDNAANPEPLALAP